MLKKILKGIEIYVSSLSTMSLISLVVFCSCNSSPLSGYKELSIEFTSEKVFSLDERTVNVIHYIQYDGADSGLISFLNENGNSIYYYDWKSQEVVKTLDFDEFGVKNKIQGYCEYGDSLMWAYSYNRNIFYELDLKTKSRIRRLNSPSPDDYMEQITPVPWCSTSTPMNVIDGKVITTGFIFYEGEEEKTMPYYSTLVFDTKSDSVSFAVRFPEFYAQDDWGAGFYYRLPFNCVDRFGNVLVSFAADHDIWIYTPSCGTTRSVEARALQLPEIKPIGARKNPERTSSELLEWYLSNPGYENIVYDEYNHVYYRVAKLPQRLKYDSKKGTQKPFVLLVLDEQFNYLGEGMVPDAESLITTNMFATKEGLAIQKRSDDADKLVFNVYSVVHDQVEESKF